MSIQMPICVIGGCETEVPGLDDGIKTASRGGVACMDCWDYHDRHGHWPDEDPDIPCPACIVDNGGVDHGCPEKDWTRLFRADELPAVCEDCGATVEAGSE